MNKFAAHNINSMKKILFTILIAAISFISATAQIYRFKSTGLSTGYVDDKGAYIRFVPYNDDTTSITINLVNYTVKASDFEQQFSILGKQKEKVNSSGKRERLIMCNDDNMKVWKVRVVRDTVKMETEVFMDDGVYVWKYRVNIIQ
jgi:uncharacterized protein YxeA